MLCALTVRDIKPRMFEQIRAVFLRNDDPENPPEGWVRFKTCCATRRSRMR
jgi:hypothetical protein